MYQPNRPNSRLRQAMRSIADAMRHTGQSAQLCEAQLSLHTPRDLATYLQYDALYQAYLNACLWLLGQGRISAPGFRKVQVILRETRSRPSAGRIS